MPTIKGPIVIKSFEASKFMEEHADEIKIKLPFTAEGFSSSKMPGSIDTKGITVKGNYQAPAKQPLPED